MGVKCVELMKYELMTTRFIDFGMYCEKRTKERGRLKTINELSSVCVGQMSGIRSGKR